MVLQVIRYWLQVITSQLYTLITNSRLEGVDLTYLHVQGGGCVGEAGGLGLAGVRLGLGGGCGRGRVLRSEVRGQRSQ